MIGSPPTIVKSGNTCLVASVQVKKYSGMSGAGFLKESVIEDRLLDPGRRLLFRRRTRRLFFPKSAVLQNLLYYRVLIDERNNPHLAAAPGTLERVYLVNTLDERAPGHSTFPTTREPSQRFCDGEGRTRKIWTNLSSSAYLNGKRQEKRTKNGIRA